MLKTNKCQKKSRQTKTLVDKNGDKHKYTVSKPFLPKNACAHLTSTRKQEGQINVIVSEEMKQKGI